MGIGRREKTREAITPNAVVGWIESASVALTSIDSELGGIAAVVESPQWDEAKTDYLLRLLSGLKTSVVDLEMELRGHVNGKLK